MIQLSVEALLFLLAGFQVKHFMCDGPLQSHAMVLAKGHYGRALGLAHAAIHGIGTALLLSLFGVTLPTLLLLAVIDSVVHYHVDFAKENVVRSQNWTTNDSKFWWALSADQALHQLTYIGLVFALIKSA